VNDTLFTLLAIAMLLTLVSLLVPAAERLRLPHTVLLASAGLGLGFLGVWLYSRRDLGVMGDAFSGLRLLEGRTDLFLPLFLPPLLFTAGLFIEVRRLFDEIFAVLLLAIVAVVVCIAGVAVAVNLATGYDIVVCLLLGAIVSTTDPAAVIGIFRDVGAPKRLSILAEGESLLNDAVAIAAFGFLIDLLVRNSLPGTVNTSSVWTPVLTFLREFGGGMVFGFLMARVVIFILPRLSDSEVAINSVTVSLAYSSYVVADKYLHVSGVISVVMAALTIAAYGPTHLHPRQWTNLRHQWHQLEFWSNCLIFILAAMAAAPVLLQIKLIYVWGVLAVAAGAILARAAVIFGLLPVLEATHRVQPVNRQYKTILVWGGLRGAVTIVLAMVAAGDSRLSDSVREFCAVLATLFVLFTLFFQATTLGVVMRLFGLDKLSAVEIALRDRVLALSRINVARHLQEIIRSHNAKVEGLDADPVSAGEAQIEAAPPELNLTLEERLKVGLLTLCTRERELYLDLFEQQTLSRRMVAILAARAERLIDAVRDRGPQGYADEIRRFAVPDRPFRAALWLHRRFGIERALTERLADRFEALMVSQEVLTELAAFNMRSVADLVGPEAAAKLGDIIGDRQQLVADALHALALQYPGYAESIRDRQLERAAIRFESAEYSRRLREAVIGREVYDDLRRELNARRKAIAGRPQLDLGLELATMIGRVSLFAGLDRETLAEVGKRLRAVVALPGEKVVATGDIADAMYFIAAGEVKVMISAGSVVLKEGDYFGERGLLESQRRNADVVADGYCHLLALHRKDFNGLLAKLPELRAKIAAVAANRLGNAAPATPSVAGSRQN
jgi:CPA1 family monovalent cation:H+ antiporter